MTDQITAEVVRGYFDAVCDEVYESMCRSSMNPGVNEAKDCGAGIYSYDGTSAQIVARAGIITHSMAGIMSSQECLDFFRGDLHPGDVLLVSDSYHGGSHLGCWTAVVPMFFEGKPRFLAAGRLHLLDQGGPAPGAVNPVCHEIWHEGFRPSPIKLYEKGMRRREVWDWLSANNRMPDLMESDLEGIIGAGKVGEQRIRELVDRYSLKTVEDSLDWIFGYSERKFREQIRQWPDGRYPAEFFVDTDYADRRDLKIAVTVTIDDDRIDFDFTGTDPQSTGPINSVPANTLAYVNVVLAALCPGIPFNSGFYRPITVTLPEGTLVNPRSPGTTALGTIVAGGQIGQAVMKACEQFAPERAGNAVIDTANTYVYGMDTRPERFLTHSSRNPGAFLFWDLSMVAMDCSGAYGVDGWGAWSPPFSVARPTNHEFCEVQYPTEYLEAEYSTDSAAPGQWRGSPAYVMRRVDRWAANPVANLNSQSLVHPFPGYVGGYEGAGNYSILNEGTPDEIVAGEFAAAGPYDPAATIFSQSGGGGGWGDPLDRDPAAVLDDVLDELVSVAGAKADYGVVVDPVTWVVDYVATAAERDRIRSGPRDRRGTGRKQTIERAKIAHRVS
ncbi:hydantoinase B/oxoprolinase family protein [Amycolatopsis jejuensis]|uniref:hydantoinase B/oxoprolinase family protein n=1 Tax=Amycolatopsis jejuensis TaxID=330084 RepID=UPI000525F494|nr:hydantoinase B/oxoprolinase family protein [Amycolatopsis jejuensis]